jgi:hypothetical protein
MSVSNPPARNNPTTVYGVDPTVWRRFRAWCVERGLGTGEQVTAALLAYMQPAPQDSASQERRENG